MAKKEKITIVCFIILVMAIVGLLFLSYSSYSKMNSLKTSCQQVIDKQTEEIEKYSEKVKSLENENLLLKNELYAKGDIGAGYVTYGQAIRELSDIYLVIESKDFDRAKELLDKFDTSTFDEGIVNYKKALEKLLP